MDPAASDNATGIAPFACYQPVYPGKPGGKHCGSDARPVISDEGVEKAHDGIAGEPGLELCAGKGLSAADAMSKGLWVACDPRPGAITINIGDALQYW
ncbi:hypothetical protein MMC29_001506 [Sticta canariensis]|nr:hypothetical protein [Sticta canariensis]